MAGVCPGPENSPDPIGVPVNPGGGLTPEREGWAPGRREIPGREMLNWSGRAGELGGYPHVRQPSEMTGPGGPSDPRGPCHSLRKAAERRPWAGFVDP